MTPFSVPLPGLSFLFLVAYLPTFTLAQNVAITSNSVAVRTRGSAGGLSTQPLPNGTLVNHPLPDGVTSLDDISIDPEDDSNEFVYAISAESRVVCSFQVTDDEGNLFLNVVGCVGSGAIPVSPFTGISVAGGTLLVSGGVGGLSVFNYDTATGVIDGTPVVQGLEFSDVVGHPDGVMISPSLAALSTDFRRGFGTQITSIQESGAGGVSVVRNIDIPGTLGFAMAEGPANFPLVSAVYRSNAGGDGNERTFLYTANGVMVVVDPNVDGASYVEIKGPSPSSFSAVTVGVNQDEGYVFFGGVSSSGSSHILQYYVGENPMTPSFVETYDLPTDSGAGRITSIGSVGNNLAYTTLGSEDGVGVLRPVNRTSCADDCAFGDAISGTTLSASSGAFGIPQVAFLTFVAAALLHCGYMEI